MNDGRKYFDKGKEFITLKESYMEMYIPADWFETNLATDVGNYLEIFGLIHLKIFDKEEKLVTSEILNFPSLINIYPTDLEQRNVQLVEGQPEIKVIVAKFYKGGNIMESNFRQNSTNVETFLNMLIRGKVPKSIPYDKVIAIWRRNLDINGVSLGVPSSILEIIIREVYRNAAKTEEPFAREAGKTSNPDMLAYATANMREICAKNSTFSAITFEDMDAMIVTSINRSKFDKSETESPLEEIIKY